MLMMFACIQQLEMPICSTEPGFQQYIYGIHESFLVSHTYLYPICHKDNVYIICNLTCRMHASIIILPIWITQSELGMKLNENAPQITTSLNVIKIIKHRYKIHTASSLKWFVS